MHAMNRLLSLTAVSVLCFAGAPLLHAQTLAGGALKANLDLPFDAGLFNEDGEDEDAPEIITFYSQQYEGDGIFYAIDRSGSMQSSGELEIAKREVSRNIMEFSNRVQFGIVFFDRGITKFPAGGRPTEANAAMKAAGLNWIQSIPGGGGSCCQQGLIEALKYANTSSASRKVVVYVGDGGGTCNGANEQTYLNQTLSVVRSQNFQRAQINAVGVLDVTTVCENFLRSLASGNGGSYVKITR
jgi:Mg-chelatase subunit ChlD